MADSAEIKQLKASQKQTNEHLTKVNDSILAMAKALGAPDASTKEKDKEKSTQDKKVLDTLKGILKAAGAGVGNAGAGLLKGVQTMMSKFAKSLLAIVSVGMIALFSHLDMKSLKKFWAAMKETMSQMYKTMKPIAVGIAKWLKDSFLPATFQLMLDGLNNLKVMFSDIGETFKGWTEMNGKEKFTSVLKAFGNVGEFMGETALDVIKWGMKLFGLEGDFGKELKKTWSKWFGGKDEGEGGTNFLSKVGSIMSTLVGMFVIGKILPFGLGSVLMLPLQLAIKGAILGTKGALGLAGHLAKSIGGVMSSIPATGIGSIAKGILGVAGKAGIIGLAAAVGVGMFAAYKSYKEGDDHQKIWETGLSKFFGALTLGLVDKKTTDKWAKKTTGLWNDMIEGISRIIPGGGDVIGKKHLQQNMNMNKVNKLRGGAASSVRKGDVAGIEAELDSLGAKSMAAMKDTTMDPQVRRNIQNDLGKKMIQLRKDKAAAMAYNKSNFDPSQTRVSSLSGMSGDGKSKIGLLTSMFPNLKLTSGWRSMTGGNNAMNNSSSDFSKTYKAKHLKGIENFGKPGSDERKAAVKQMRLNGFQSQHEHGNAIDFSYPKGYGPETFSDFKNVLLKSFPGAKIVPENDHVHMEFNKKNSGLKLAALHAEATAANRTGQGGGGGNSSINSTINHTTADQSINMAPTQNDPHSAESKLGQ